MLVDKTSKPSAAFAAYVSRFAARFPRVESRRQMRAYVFGLLGEARRKNSWTLAEAAGDAGPERMQRLLNFYAWDCDGVRDDLRAVLVEALAGTRDAVLIVGEAQFLKKGNKSAGVSRQYSRTTNRMENVQTGVFLAYETSHKPSLVDRELFLPKEWATDRHRRRIAGIADETAFATKPALAQKMIDRAIKTRVPFGWVTDDESCGHDSGLRMWLETKEIAHVLAMPPREMTVSAWAGGRGRPHRTHRHDWKIIEIRKLRRPGWAHWLLARRSISEPRELAGYVCFAPVQTKVAELARVAGSREAIEQCLLAARRQAGLDQYQVRGYEAWYRHITLAMVAAAFLVITSRR
ncbi:IS701 family transposase [Catelliglobosispora koreensis]|uniref:IS701 family transposase n=1 Tax=Catelliglobosispora koreensis TaxID=129052 RepID=UPI000685C4D2|nr:IS701 family transposase [Catelliglobosispora koreensis]